jgi:hypothetical protein
VWAGIAVQVVSKDVTKADAEENTDGPGKDGSRGTHPVH